MREHLIFYMHNKHVGSIIKKEYTNMSQKLKLYTSRYVEGAQKEENADLMKVDNIAVAEQSLHSLKNRQNEVKNLVLGIVR